MCSVESSTEKNRIFTIYSITIIIIVTIFNYAKHKAQVNKVVLQINSLLDCFLFIFT